MTVSSCAAGKEVKEEKKINNNLIAVIGVAISLLAIYLASLSVFLAFIGAAGILASNLWGANGVRTVAKYGIGTGVPSVGMLALGGAVGAVFAGLYIGKMLRMELAAPILAFVLSLVTGLLIGVCARYILKMNIPVMVRCMTEICGAGALLFMSQFVTITGYYGYTALEKLSEIGVVLFIFIIGALGMLHPYNACLGADERHGRTLKLALATGSAQIILAGIVSLYFLGVIGILTLMIGAVAWAITYRDFVKTSFKEGIVVSTGLIPEVEKK